MDSNKDVIIVGGGIIGLACAHYLLKKNTSVRIIEQDTIGSGASHGNCGLLYFSGIIPLCSPGAVTHEVYRAMMGSSPLYIKPTLDLALINWLFRFALHCNVAHMNAGSKAKNELIRYSMDLVDLFFSDHPLDCDFEKKGLLTLFTEKKYFQKYRNTNALLEEYNFGATRLDMAETRKVEPAVGKNIVGAWYNRNDWHLRPEMIVEAWKKLLIQKGLIIEEKCKMLNFEIKNNKIRSVNTVKGQYKADAFVLTTGAWASEVNQQLKLNIPVQPGKGYSITMEKPDRAPDIPCYLYEKNVVVTPWKSGYRLGGTMEFSGFSNTLNKKRLSRLIKGAQDYLITRTGRPILEEWTGLRPMTYDDLPIIDRSPLQDNLYIATGHGMLGLTMATGTGKLVCDMVYEKESPIDMRPFSLSRF